jgi:hypothetical protein
MSAAKFLSRHFKIHSKVLRQKATTDGIDLSGQGRVRDAVVVKDQTRELTEDLEAVNTGNIVIGDVTSEFFFLFENFLIQSLSEGSSQPSPSIHLFLSLSRA